jgi:hypothetical protein
VRREAFETATRRASHGFSTGTLARYGPQIAVSALVIVVLTGGRIKEALPLLGDAGIEATGDHTRARP